MKNKSQVSALLVIYAVIFSACTAAASKEEQEINRLVKESFRDHADNTNVVVISEQNCSSCIKDKLMALGKELPSGQQLAGIIYRYSTKENRDLDHLKEETKSFIQWKDAHDIQLLKSLSAFSGKKSGPYLVSYRSGKIQAVEEIH